VRIAAPLLLAFLAGCLSLSREAPRQTRYVLDVERPARSAPAADGVLLVRQFQSSAEAASRAFTYLHGEYEVEVDPYHGLLLPPSTAFEDATARWLDASGLCARVVRPGTREDPDWVLEGDLSTFRAVIDGQRPPAAELVLSLTALDRQGRTVLWHRTYEVTEPVEDSTPVAFVAGWSRALARTLTETEAELRSALQSGSAESPAVR